VTDTDQPPTEHSLHDILIADDDPDLRSLFARILGRAGFDADTVEEGIAALAAAGQAPRKLVILDIDMPGATGLEVCRVLKAQNGPSRVGGGAPDGLPRVLLVSAHNTRADLETGYAQGQTTTSPSPSARVNLSTVLQRCSADADHCSLRRRRCTARQPAAELAVTRPEPAGRSPRAAMEVLRS
jgi:CheY-like chemotaxis protein